ncbi:hypothetical protein F5Y06DRAFT_248594 [Hypoxylon sp. FL0890]|nr:hypothetical protein F5Y06DRAFT_248594 [Hypoxylon sp. FL0890]
MLATARRASCPRTWAASLLNLLPGFSEVPRKRLVLFLLMSDTPDFAERGGHHLNHRPGRPRLGSGPPRALAAASAESRSLPPSWPWEMRGPFMQIITGVPCLPGGPLGLTPGCYICSRPGP